MGSSRTKNKLKIGKLRHFSIQDGLLPTIWVKLMVVRCGERFRTLKIRLALSRVGTTLGETGRQKISPKTPCGVKKFGWCPKKISKPHESPGTVCRGELLIDQ